VLLESFTNSENDLRIYLSLILNTCSEEWSYSKLKIIERMSTDAIGNPERHVRKASHRGSKQQ